MHDSTICRYRYFSISRVHVLTVNDVFTLKPEDVECVMIDILVLDTWFFFTNCYWLWNSSRLTARTLVSVRCICCVCVSGFFFIVCALLMLYSYSTVPGYVEGLAPANMLNPVTFFMYLFWICSLLFSCRLLLYIIFVLSILFCKETSISFLVWIVIQKLFRGLC